MVQWNTTLNQRRERHQLKHTTTQGGPTAFPAAQGYAAAIEPFSSFLNRISQGKKREKKKKKKKISRRDMGIISPAAAGAGAAAAAAAAAAARHGRTKDGSNITCKW